MNVVLIGEGEFQLLSGTRGLIHRQGHRLVVLPASHRQVAVQQGFPLPVRADAHQRKLHPRGVHEVPAEAVQTGKFQRPYHGAFRQGEGDAVGGSALCIQGFPLAKKGRPIGLNGTYIPDFQWLSRISQRGRESQHTNVPIVSPLLLRRLALGKDTLPGRSAKNVRPAPDQVSHRIFGLYPGSAGHSPAGTGLDGEPKIQASGFLAQIRDHLVPIRGKRHHRNVYARPPAPEGAVKPLDAGYPGPGNGLQVCIHSFPGYVIPYKMEPGFRPEDLGRGNKVLFVLRSERGVQQRHRCLNIGHLGPRKQAEEQARKGKENSFHGYQCVLFTNIIIFAGKSAGFTYICSIALLLKSYTSTI